MAAAQELPGDFIIGGSRQNQEDRFNKLVYPLLPRYIFYNKKKTLLMRNVNLLSSIIMRVWKKILPTTNDLLPLGIQTLQLHYKAHRYYYKCEIDLHL